MMKFVRALFVYLAFCSAAIAQVGQIPIYLQPAPSGGAYTGPGDVVDYSTGAYYALRAYNSATRGNKLVNVCDITGGTVNGACVDLLSSASTGILVPQSGIGTNSVTCPGTNCGIKIYYDLTAAGNCGGSCDATQTTATSMHTLATGCAGQSTVTYCATTHGHTYSPAANYATGTGPLFVSGSGKLANTGSDEAFIGNGSGSFEIGVFGTPAFFSANSQTNFIQVAGASGAYHGMAGLGNASGAYLAVDAAAPTTGTAPVTSFSALISVGGNAFANTAGGIWLEAGVTKVAVASSTATTLNGNSKTFWGY